MIETSLAIFNVLRSRSGHSREWRWFDRRNSTSAWPLPSQCYYPVGGGAMKRYHTFFFLSLVSLKGRAREKICMYVNTITTFTIHLRPEHNLPRTNHWSSQSRGVATLASAYCVHGVGTIDAVGPAQGPAAGGCMVGYKETTSKITDK